MFCRRCQNKPACKTEEWATGQRLNIGASKHLRRSIHTIISLGSPIAVAYLHGWHAVGFFQANELEDDRELSSLTMSIGSKIAQHYADTCILLVRFTYTNDMILLWTDCCEMVWSVE